MPDPSTDEQFLRRALDLARQGIGLASPNPYVGAVIVDPQDNIVGTGVYTYDGVMHAEVRALEHAGGKARGGTLYINLEPHSHQGRTPPCTDALIAAGIRRVVGCMPDPNPKVSGRGFEKLRSAGVNVDVGRLEAEARCLNEAFARYIRHRVPLVTLKSAMTLDGKIAPPPETGLKRSVGMPAGGWITGEAARSHVQQQRHESDAILLGVGTILADDPLLTDRSGNPRRRPLLRVVLDSGLRLPLQSRLVQSAVNDVLVFCSAAEEEKKLALEARAIRVEQVPSGADGHPDLHVILRRLGQLEITSVMIEGGSALNGAALAAGIVDKVFLYYAPTILGTGSVPFATGASFRGDEALRLDRARLHQFEDDIALEGYLRDPYAE
ncbi:MAG TPA: bifunctional diaminohydroxyphosphoribosylaminopyrimidine deaminase/5-amino-6-(5-phosphoribosylamino)uracil reductase RibD [Candidatus Dormibacteraeota bacterium]|jgi:diaminohydroxyphosphoribosylaminopyrimidine deaminase/5-amino-6-(5-phosphoribosylamino)uracil reductase|nr:bifunctional diaminohydroxyphosphoribosylaminopyrimidine deaminase/5-amino-6-(5-phosphoribosylamino)uracil reductase RibD [Candidatus Dormibacteraeota bacterium]